MSWLQDSAAEAAEFIRARWPHTPRVGIVLGTGYGSMAERVAKATVIPYSEIPHFPQSTALAHVGRLVCGEWFGVPVAVMQGRSHLYEGYSIDQVALPTVALCLSGVEQMIVTNAAGGVNPQHRMGDVMLLESHLNLLWGEPRLAKATRAPRASHANPYCPELLQHVSSVSRSPEFSPHVGVYAAVSGPSYETRAEYRCFRKLGADAVGMSTVPEAIAASHFQRPVLGVSVITNVARPDAPDLVDAEDVVAASQSAAPNVLKVIEAALDRAK